MHKIDLSKFNFRTDLVLEEITRRKEFKDKRKNNNTYKDISISNFYINKEEGRIINKKPGHYTTISFNDTTDSTNQKNIKHVFKREIKKYLKNISKTDLVLIIGLGNIDSTPDSLGPRIADSITTTNHLYELGICDFKYQKVASFKPDVTGKTGIDTIIQIKSLVNSLKPKMVIIIDALASSSISRVNKTIQITDTGINPGSGVNNARGEISFDTLKTPVIAVGIPTVVDATSIVFDTILYMQKKYSFLKNNEDKKYMLTFGNYNYLKNDIIINNDDKELLFGLIGKLSDEDLKKLIFEVLTPIGYNLMVTTKEIDFIIDNLEKIISSSLNDIFSM